MTQTLWSRSLRMASSLGRRCAREDKRFEVDFVRMEKLIGNKVAVKDEGGWLAWYQEFCAEHRTAWEETPWWPYVYGDRLLQLVNESWSENEHRTGKVAIEQSRQRNEILINFFWIAWEVANEMLAAFLEMCQNLSVDVPCQKN